MNSFLFKHLISNTENSRKHLSSESQPFIVGTLCPHIPKRMVSIYLTGGLPTNSLMTIFLTYEKLLNATKFPPEERAIPHVKNSHLGSSAVCL